MADIVKQLETIQGENKDLKKFKKDARKALDKMCELFPEKELNEYEKEIKELKEKIEKLKEKNEQNTEQITVEKVTDFEEKISSFYGLYNDSDKEKFLEIMLNENSKNYFNGKRYGV